MSTVYVLSTAIVPLEFFATKSDGGTPPKMDPVTGKTTLQIQSIRRQSDGQYFDFSTDRFAAVPVTKTALLAEVSLADEPGWYHYFPSGVRGWDLNTIGNPNRDDKYKVTFGPESDADVALFGAIEIVVDHWAVDALEGKRLIELQRGAHTHQVNGEIWCVAPTLGDDTDGNGSVAKPFQTIQAAIDAAGDGTHDVIQLLADVGTGITESVISGAPINVNKRYLFIRGPGGDFRVRRSDNGDVFNVTADGCELLGFRVETHTAGSGKAVLCTAVDFVRVHEVLIGRSQGDAIRLDDCNFCLVHDNTLRNTGASGAGHGITIASTGGDMDNHVFHNRVYNTQGDGIRVTGALTDQTVIRNNQVHGSTGWGVNIAAGTNALVIENVLHNNNGLDDTAAINDEGVNTHLHNNCNFATETDVAIILGLAGKGNVIVDGGPGFATLQYDAGGHVAVIRTRVFSDGNVPATGGGTETTGLLRTITIASTADGTFINLPNFIRALMV